MVAKKKDQETIGQLFAGVAAWGMRERIPSYLNLIGEGRELLLDGVKIEPIRRYLYIALWIRTVNGLLVEPYDPRGYHRLEFWPVPNLYGQFSNANDIQWIPTNGWGRLTHLSIHTASDGPDNMVCYQPILGGGIDVFQGQPVGLAPGTLRLNEHWVLGNIDLMARSMREERGGRG